MYSISFRTEHASRSPHTNLRCVIPWWISVELWSVLRGRRRRLSCPFLISRIQSFSILLFFSSSFVGGVDSKNIHKCKHQSSSWTHAARTMQTCNCFLFREFSCHINTTSRRIRSSERMPHHDCTINTRLLHYICIIFLCVVFVHIQPDPPRSMNDCLFIHFLLVQLLPFIYFSSAIRCCSDNIMKINFTTSRTEPQTAIFIFCLLLLLRPTITHSKANFVFINTQQRLNKQFACGLVAIAEAHTHTHAARITHTLRNCNIRCHFIAMRLSEFSNTSVLYSEFPRLQFHIFEFMRLNLWLYQHPASSTNNFHFIRALCKHPTRK